jgi:protein-tyrosine phosphatase
MVYWITRTMGVKAVNEELNDEEKGSVIIDVRNVVDGSNPQGVLTNTLGKLAKFLSSRERIIIQCQAGISRSPAFAAAMLVYGTNMEWDDAIDYVRKKCPRTQINQDLLKSLEEIM